MTTRTLYVEPTAFTILEDGEFRPACVASAVDVEGARKVAALWKEDVFVEMDDYIAFAKRERGGRQMPRPGALWLRRSREISDEDSEIW